MIFSRTWAMPNRHTFSIPPIGEFVKRYLSQAIVSVDPFSGDKQWATHNNDLAHGGVDAEEFLNTLNRENVVSDLVIFDPPYSPRQVSECYKSIGLKVGMKDTQNAVLYQRVRNAITPILSRRAIILSFGWNTVGMGKSRGFEIIEIMLCCHGGAHNDTICLAERRVE